MSDENALEAANTAVEESIQKSTEAPVLSIVVSTIGRPDAMKRLIGSLADQTRPDLFELIVVDQSDDQQSAAVAQQATVPFRVSTTRSERGACLGRNVGTRLARGQILSFPDDNCQYTATTVADVVAAMTSRPGVGILSGLLVTESGNPSMLRWPSTTTVITRKNVQQTAIEATMFVRREVFVAAGGFDESIGVGSAGPYQAGEATDLILRALATGTTGLFDPSIHVVHEDFREVVEANFTQKMRGYGCGLGHVYRTNRLPAREVAYYATRKLAAAVVRSAKGRRDLARADLAWARGLVTGYANSGKSLPQLRAPAELDYREQ
jgi:glycosyltransferase involved in cell wall biosynthesis